MDTADIDIDYDTAIALLAWQLELGVTDAVLDEPVDRFVLADEAPKPAVPAVAASGPALPKAPVVASAPEVDPIGEAKARAAACTTLEELREAMAAFPHCELKRGAKSLVFADGNPSARVMVIGEAPGRDEDLEGRPFVGRAGQLFDKMFAAIGLSRTEGVAERSLYITNSVPWRPPSNREPTREEAAMMRPFLQRHVALADPEVLVVLGNVAAQAVLGQTGITRLRGGWHEAWGRPVLPMFHPAYLLRTPHAKREAWADLLTLQARLRET